ncbi:hypothetical protein EDB19DRAFT_1669128 [Suillus lakei]|nr:hypothetical protein EDB19DRAFT_1669128 [Suillus lakei]
MEERHIAKLILRRVLLAFLIICNDTTTLSTTCTLCPAHLRRPTEYVLPRHVAHHFSTHHGAIFTSPLLDV